MPHITSVHNPRIKAAMKLRDRRERVGRQRFLIDGRREIERAIAGGIEIEEAFVAASFAGTSEEDSSLNSLVESLAQRGTQIFTTAATPLARLAFGERDEGMVAVARAPQRGLAELALPPNPLVAVIEGIEKPGNVGAVLRSADAAGVSAVIVADGGTDLYNPNAIRASLGAIFTLPVVAAASSEALAWLRERKFAILAARVDGAIDYSQANYAGPTAIVLGSEAHGLSPLWQSDDITPIKLPMHGVVDSLNVSATAAVLFYEAGRRRG
jgi:RNA methyltransferase, TrmH family